MKNLKVIDLEKLKKEIDKFDQRLFPNKYYLFIDENEVCHLSLADDSRKIIMHKNDLKDFIDYGAIQILE